MATVLNLFSRTIGRFFTAGFRSGRGEQQSQVLSYGNSQKASQVSDERALQLSAVWGCHTLLTDTLSMIPMKLYQQNKDGSRAEILTHPLSRVFSRSPNQYMSIMDYRTAMNFNLIGFGNGHSFITRNNQGDVIDLFPMQSAQIRQKIDSGGRLLYQYEDDVHGQKDYGAEDIFHVRGFGYTGLTGLSTFSFARRLLGLAAATQDHGEHFYVNGARPSGVFTLDKVLTKDQREAIRENFVKKIEGEDNAFKTLVLEAGMKYEAMGLSPLDMQMIDQQRFNGEDICRFFRCPPFLLGFQSAVTAWSGLEQINLGFLTYTLQPWFRRWEHAASRQLLRPEEQLDMYFEHDPSDFLRADLKALSEYLAKMVQNGIMSRNEAREKLRMKGYTSGDVYTAQVNLAPVEMLGKVKPGNGGGDNDGNQDDLRQ